MRLTADRTPTPFIAAIGFFLMSYLGIAISLWPMIVPYHHPVAGRLVAEYAGLSGGRHAVPAADHPDVHGWSYWVFRGKVRADIGYH